VRPETEGRKPDATAPKPEKIAAQAEMLANRLRKRQRHLRKWARRTNTAVYRLYDRDIPEIPLVLDWVSGTSAGVPCSALTGALYRRPYEKDEAEEAAWLAAMKAAAANALEIDEGRIFFKERRHISHHGQSGAEDNPAGDGPGGSSGQYGKLADQRFTVDVREGELGFRVNLSDYLDMGLFPDRRLLRAKIRDEAAGKRVLNLFAYTCSFSVCAVSGGAAAVDSVDLSRTYLEWGMLNFELNGFKGIKASPWDLSEKAAGRPSFRFIKGDVLRFIPEAKKANLRWDLIILDPPTFSNSKKMLGSLDIKRDYRELINGCLTLLAPGGNLLVSVNARSFKIGAGDFPAAVTDLTEELRDEDFRGRHIPACWVLG
jgi:23S rRNA G2069 N7-methylase RlmK/C1962 C5-methylase RlmI